MSAEPCDNFPDWQGCECERTGSHTVHECVCGAQWDDDGFLLGERCTRHPWARAAVVIEEVAEGDADRYAVGQRLCARCLQAFR